MIMPRPIHQGDRFVPAIKRVRGSIAVSICLIVPFLLRCGVSGEAGLYGGVDPDEYVTGRFQPGKGDTFVSLADIGVPTDGKRQLFRREAAVALKRLYGDFRAHHPKAPFHVRSSTRNFFDQKQIWDEKWRAAASNPGCRTDKDTHDPRAKALCILMYSSMPGTSRHHWGTDFDLQVLNNDYYERGKGREIHRWLSQNAHRYGFCQPFTAGRSGGYREEKWHWSYAPLAEIFRARWNDFYRRDPESFSRRGLFSGSEVVGKMSSIYVNAINEECKGITVEGALEK